MDSDIDLNAIRRSFELETAELLTAIEEALIALENRPDDDSLVETIFRGAHTIKGNARVVGIDHIAEFTHVFEDLLESLRRKELRVSRELVTLFLRAVDALRGMTPAAVAGATEMSPEQQRIRGELVRMRPGGVAKGGSIEADAPEKGEDNGSEEEGFRLESSRTKTLRVGIDKLDRIMDLVGEISIARGKIAEMLEGGRELTRQEILEAHRESDLVYMDLQEEVMKMRMVAVGPLFREYFRTVRDLSLSCGKAARLVLEGEDVEVDTTVVEHLRDPLTHLVRNAIRHGVEEPGLRHERGKPPVGKITLRARHEAGSIVIQITDDGAGLDREKILRQARRSHLIEETERPADKDLLDLVFEPGFSTEEKVSEISGRGVGMDVVRRNIEQLRGSTEIESREGEGTVVTLRMPLTLAIIEGFRIGVGAETYVVPLDAVVECIELPEEDRAPRGGRGVMNLRDKPLPFLEVRSLFGLGGEAPERESVIVIRHGGLEAGLAVDFLYGEGQTVIKPLHKAIEGAAGLAGAAIMGNGRAGFVLDVPGLLKEALARTRQDENAALHE